MQNEERKGGYPTLWWSERASLMMLELSGDLKAEREGAGRPEVEEQVWVELRAHRWKYLLWITVTVPQRTHILVFGAQTMSDYVAKGELRLQTGLRLPTAGPLKCKSILYFGVGVGRLNAIKSLLRSRSVMQEKPEEGHVDKEDGAERSRCRQLQLEEGGHEPPEQRHRFSPRTLQSETTPHL